MTKRSVLIVLLLCLLSTQFFVLAQEEEGLYVDANQNLGEISPLVYGANHGPWTEIALSAIPLAQEAGISYLRYPGGNWGDLNNLTPFHLDSYAFLIRELNAQASIHVRLKNGTPEAAAELVRYMNIEKEYGVRYWSIGNEPNLYGDEYTTDIFNREWREFAEAMLEVDPNIILVGPDISQYPGTPEGNPKDSTGRDWMEEFLKANGDMVDIVAVHRYPFPRSFVSGPATYDDLRNNSREWDAIIPYLREVIQEYAGREIPIAVSEINSHWDGAGGGEGGVNTHYNAIWFADVLGRLIRQRVEIVAYFTLYTAAGLNPFGMLERYDERPTYYLYKMYSHFGQELLFSSSDDPDVSIYAARREDGAITVMVINLSLDEKTSNLTLDNFTVEGNAEVWRFDLEHEAEQIDEQDLTSRVITVPGQSITVYIVSPEV